MIERITMQDYFGPYFGKGEDTPPMQENARVLLLAVNSGLDLAVADGVELQMNPDTHSYVSGQGHGGFRDSACTVGATSSRHRQAKACDIFDPHRKLAAWSVQNKDRLVALGIFGMERPEWTPTWVHWQIEWVHSRTWCYVPDATPALAEALPEEHRVVASLPEQSALT